MRKLDIYVNQRLSAWLSCDNGEYQFGYLPDTPETHAVALGLPVNEDYTDTRYMMVPPPLQVGFPEGALLDAIYRSAGKSLKLDEDIDVLALVGRNMIGRVQMVPEGEPLNLHQDHIIRNAQRWMDETSNNGQVLLDAVNRIAENTGLSGMFPKGFAEKMSYPHEGTLSLPYGDSIIKLETDHYLGVAVIEHACLSICRHAGIHTAESSLAHNGESLLVKRFDIKANGERRGFEDFCGLLGMSRTAKYDSDLKNIPKIISWYILEPESQQKAMEQFFRITVMNTALRNGDAHLKNFGLLYDDPTQEPVLAPAYDIICTTAWIPNDRPALPMNGTHDWPDKPTLTDFAKTACHLNEKKIDEIFKDVRKALWDSIPYLDRLKEEYPETVEIDHMQGVIKESLKSLFDDVIYAGPEKKEGSSMDLKANLKP